MIVDDLTEHDLAYEMLVELLAHQFAFPVKWIDTQDQLLRTKGVKRVIEIGPTSTLASMAKKTIQTKYRDHDAALSVKRQVASCQSDEALVYYKRHDPTSRAIPPSAPVNSGPVAVLESGAARADERTEKTTHVDRWAPEPTDATRQEPPAAPSADSCRTKAPVSGKRPLLPDSPVSAKHILRTLVAVKLKKKMQTIKDDDTIKALVGGRSTLENEMVGDLISEFGTLPDKAEELTVDSLAQQLGSGHPGKLGKESSSLTAKMLASKMPGGFGAAAVRAYLGSEWGLPPGHQNSVLLCAAASATSEARLANEAAAKAFLDQVVQEYAADRSITFPSLIEQATAPSQQVHVSMDPQLLQRIEERHNVLVASLCDVLSSSMISQQPVASIRPLASAAAAAEMGRDTETCGLQVRLDELVAELGESYVSGIATAFDRKKTRVYDSYWNWAVIDVLDAYYRLVTRAGCLDDRPNRGRGEALADASSAPSHHLLRRIANRSGKELLETVLYLKKKSDCVEAFNVPAAHDFLDSLLNICRESSSKPPICSQDVCLTAPKTVVDASGFINTAEEPRPGTANLAEYAAEMALLLRVKSRTRASWTPDPRLTAAYAEQLAAAARSGLSFSSKCILLIGSGPGSIGAELLRGFVSGGARVVVTTSNFSSSTARFYQRIYAKHGSKGSRLVLVPFNQGSVRDVESLVEWIYDGQGGLGWDLDLVLPFAAISERGRDIDGLDSRSELAHRIMLTNTVRLLGAVKRRKAEAGTRCRPAQVLLPLSPNHGLFGGDGLYSESKMGLEALLGKWWSEDWSEYLSLCGVVIGWTRGTGLMGANDSVAAGIEAAGVRTFTGTEMAFNIMCLAAPSVADLCQTQPLYADLSGGFDAVPDFNGIVLRARRDLQERSEIAKAIQAEDRLEHSVGTGERNALDLRGHGDEPLGARLLAPAPPPQRRLRVSLDFPVLGSFEAEVGQHLGASLGSMVDLDRIVVVTGFAEVGPYGSARTRWQMESSGRLTPEGSMELAWITGLIKRHDGPVKGSQGEHCGWVDAQSGEPVRDEDIAERYGERILQHTGIRAVEPALWDGYDPHRKQTLHEVILQQDMPAFEASEQDALEFKREQGEFVDVARQEDGGGGSQYRVRFRKGATVMLPKALDFHNDVAGQIPTGWDARRYGIPEDIISQVDRTTLFALVCTAEALLSSGITDPYELYRHVHVSEVGNCLGSGAGGATSLSRMHKARYRGQAVQSDILQETFVSTLTAWVNMLLLSSSGPLRTPVGACATALESLDSAYDLITGGKARVCVVGGADDLEEGLANEFANMKATVSATDERARGRAPAEMSRPAASSRGGFVESHGCGVQVVMSARLALDMGVPIYGIVAMTSTASDKVGRSVPAPGRGVAGNAREAAGPDPAPLLDLKFRRTKLAKRRRYIASWRRTELEALEEEAAWAARAAHEAGDTFDRAAFIEHGTRAIEGEAASLEREATYSIGNAFWHGDPRVSPIRGSLAVWGLTVDDITAAYMHGTSTVLNEKNEFEILQRQLQHLGRARGNRLLGVFQKHLTGHPKGAAGAWMLNGALQMAQTGLVPGNANADNVDEALRAFDYVAVPGRAVQTGGVDAFSVTSFGFGQKGTQVIGVHPRYLYAVLPPGEYEDYRARVARRRRTAEQFLNDGLWGGSLVRLKTEAPFDGGGDKESEFAALLDPTLRCPSAS